MTALMQQQDQPMLFDDLEIPEIPLEKPVLKVKRKRRTKAEIEATLEAQINLLVDVLDIPASLQNSEEFSDYEVEEIRCYMFMRHISFITDRRTGMKTRKEAIAWIMEDEDPMNPHPFSFQRCANSMKNLPGEIGEWLSLSNLETVRINLLYLAKKYGINTNPLLEQYF